jgi:parvulin-like peptidyl-prolyl isomerase
LQPEKEKRIIVKVLMSSFFLLLLSVSAGLCFPQAAAKTQQVSPKAAKPAPESVSKPERARAEEEIPPAAADALFPAVVARVNGKSILGRDLERYVRRQLTPIGSPEWKNLREEYRGQLVADGLASLTNAKLIYDKALASGLTVTDSEVQDEFQKIAKTFKSDAEMNIALAKEMTDRESLERDLRESLVLAKYINETIEKRVTVTPEEVAKYYSSHPNEFQHPDIVRTSHILIQPAGDTPEQDSLAKQRAEEILARVKKGEDFARLAKENSMDPSAAQGGDVGFASKASLTAEYGEAAFSLPVGGVKLVKTQVGYHVLKVTDKKKEGLSTLEEVRTQLIEFLKNEKAQGELTKMVNQLRDQANIEILIPSGQPLKP